MIATRLAAETLRFLPRKQISRAIGRVASRTGPDALLARAIDMYVRAYSVDLSECQVPSGGFRTFNEFFTRPLRDGARPLDPDLGAILSPADGKVEDAGAIDDGAVLFIKGRRYELAELLGDREDAARLAGGAFVVVYLSPRDYHRVHAPASGEITSGRHIGGTLYPVNRIGVEHVPGLFAKNERVVITQTTPRFGSVVTVMVGALVVGGIVVRFDPTLVSRRGAARGEVRYASPRPSVARGEELGSFELGSTAIVLIPKSAGVVLDVVPGQPIRMGEAIARIARTASA